MARLESQALAGYFPTPPQLASSLASLVEPTGRFGSFNVLDPAAGTGAMLADLASIWSDQLDGTHDQVVTHGCELEAGRAAQLAEVATHSIHGDAFRLSWTSGGAEVLFLNPPYDGNRRNRLEHAFLERFTPALSCSGVLLYIVPVSSLAVSAAFLDRNYRNIDVWAFPAPHFDRFKQCVVRATHEGSSILDGDRERLEAIARGAISLEPLPEPGTVKPAPAYLGRRFALTLDPYDKHGFAQSLQPFGDNPLAAASRSVGDLVGRTYSAATVPKPAHVALALGAGYFNGKRIEAPAGSGLPPILLKGVLRKQLVEASTTVDDDGATTSSTQIERPALDLRGLDLLTYDFLEPEITSTGSGATEVADMNAADLMHAYGPSLVSVLRSIFPPLHDPANSAGAVALPSAADRDSERTPYEVQAHAVQTLLKVASRGDNPSLLAQVGTGKTTMALVFAAALSPDHHGRTLDSVRQAGTPDVVGLPVVRRTLVLCPPHLVDTWEEEAAIVWPTAKVVRVESLRDLDNPDGVLFLLSREKAKLGARIAGVRGRCPKCGAGTPALPATLARKRSRCQERPISPSNRFAELATALASIMVAAFPALREPRELPVPRTILRTPVERAERFDPEPLEAFLVALIDAAPLAVDDSDARLDYVGAVQGIARAARLERFAAALLDDLVREHKKVTAQWSPWTQIEEGANALRRFETTQTPKDALVQALDLIRSLAKWDEGDVCGEPLFQHTPQPRRFPIATHITRNMRGHFGLVVVDEFHEYAHLGSAQQLAAERLIGSGECTLALTGSLMNGYASSLFATTYVLSKRFRELFNRDEAPRFVSRYGFAKLRFTPKDGQAPENVDYGSVTDRQNRCNVRRVGECPGVHPSMIVDHLMPTAVFVHRDELAVELPERTEEQVPLDVGDGDHDIAILNEYNRIRGILIHQIMQDRGSERAGKLWGALGQLPTFLDRATDDLEPFEIRYPEDVGGDVIATAGKAPAEYRTPKERWMLEQVAESVEKGDRTIVFVANTGATSKLPARLVRLFAEDGIKAVYLSAQKVSAGKRQAWIERHVNHPMAPVLIVNPNSVRTGLNNLVGFNRAIWHQIDYSAQTVRQANGRIYRIGQKKPVHIAVPFYPETTQQIAVRLVAAKISASLQTDGLDLISGLEAAGAGNDHESAMATTLALGEAIHQQLVA